jgi:hypothetical protein
MSLVAIGERVKGELRSGRGEQWADTRNDADVDVIPTFQELTVVLVDLQSKPHLLEVGAYAHRAALVLLVCSVEVKAGGDEFDALATGVRPPFEAAPEVNVDYYPTEIEQKYVN